MHPLPRKTVPASSAFVASRYWRIHKKYTLAGLVICAMILFLSGYYGKQERIHRDYQQFDQALLALGEAQGRIGQQLESNPRASIAASAVDLIPDEFPIPVSYKSVSRDGAILIVSHLTGMVLVLQPQTGTDNQVVWSCFGSSIHGEAHVPPRCRESRDGK